MCILIEANRNRVEYNILFKNNQDIKLESKQQKFYNSII